MATVVLLLAASARERASVPELRRPGSDQLAAGLLRRQLPTAVAGQGQVRPASAVPLPAAHPPARVADRGLRRRRLDQVRPAGGPPSPAGGSRDRRRAAANLADRVPEAQC